MPLHQLEMLAREVNRRVPMMLDQHTRLDGAHAAQNALTYKFTLLNVQAQQMDIQDFEAVMAIRVIKNVCGRLQMLITHGVTIHYYYRDNAGNKITTLSVGKDECGY